MTINTAVLKRALQGIGRASVLDVVARPVQSAGRQALLELAPAVVFVAAITAVIHFMGGLPSPASHLYYLAIVLVAFRFSIASALLIALLASIAVSPAMEVFGRHFHPDDPELPAWWLARPAAYLLVATITGLLASNLRREHQQVGVCEVDAESRQQELQTFALMDTLTIHGEDEETVVQQMVQQVAALTGARICAILVPTEDGKHMRPWALYGITEQELRRVIAEAGQPPFGEGAVGWAMLHGRVAASSNMSEDPRYEKIRGFIRGLGCLSQAAAPIALNGETVGALTVCYPEERQFSDADLAQLERLSRRAALAIGAVRQRDSLARLAFETAVGLAEAIESRDPYTGGHCSRLAENGIAIARRLGLDAKEIDAIRLAAAMHDVGKVTVPDVVLKKPGLFTPEDYAIMKQHCYAGGQICKRISFLRHLYPIVYHHHERYDGEGYPDGLKGDDIPLGARIIAVVDAYDAMTNDRAYRAAMPPEEAARILREGAGSQWDPKVVEVFLGTLAPVPTPPPEADAAQAQALPIHPVGR
ncbi:MAG: HD domain-containing phosphohydrolase [Chloroflexota bacterium]|nr:HD domain-containing phosphohydrolase [Chloroflexota bacterium]